MSKGFGAVERRLLDALIQRRDHDQYVGADLWLETPVVRARWRWYTVDFLELVEFGAPRSKRVSLHRAVRSLHRARRLEIETVCPYDQPFGAYEIEFYGDDERDYVGGFDLGELTTMDHRWPHRQGRCLWFRLPPPPMDLVPDGDQLYVLEQIIGAEQFVDFAEILDRAQAWTLPIASLIRWLFCGFRPGETAQ